MSSGSGNGGRRRRRDVSHKANHERWMISYADMLTLLLAVFIVLWASSSQNKRKMEEVAASMLQAFQGTPPALLPLPASPHAPMHALPKPMPRPLQAPQSLDHPSSPTMPEIVSRTTQSVLQPSLLAMKNLLKQLEKLLQPEIRRHQIDVLTSPLTIRIRLNAKILFKNGKADLTSSAKTILTPLANVLALIPVGYMITIQGYTDDKPIDTASFPSNWQLSAARAMSVLLLLRHAGVSGRNLSAEGFGQYHPIASNKTKAGRAANRRVEIVITAPRTKTGVQQGALALPDGGRNG